MDLWTHGKRCDRFKKYKNLAINFSELKHYNHSLYTAEHLDILPFVYNRYTAFSAAQLVDKTHNETPYKTCYNPYNTNEIPNDIIRNFFIDEFKKEAQSYTRYDLSANF